MINLECAAVLQIPTLVLTVAREISVNEGEVGCKGWRAIKSDGCLDEHQPKASDNLESCPHTVQHSQGASCRYWGSCGCFYLGLCNWGSINWRRECKGGEQVQVSAEQKPTEGDTGGFCADIFSYPLFSWFFCWSHNCKTFWVSPWQLCDTIHLLWNIVFFPQQWSSTRDEHLWPLIVVSTKVSNINSFY